VRGVYDGCGGVKSYVESVCGVFGGSFGEGRLGLGRFGEIGVSGDACGVRVPGGVSCERGSSWKIWGFVECGDACGGVRGFGWSVCAFDGAGLRA